MSTPARSAEQFLWALALGCLLGAVYELLRPLRVRCKTLGDLLFVASAWGAWIYHSFAICAGDMRIVCLVGLFGGAMAWSRVFGRPFQRIFRAFWRVIGAIIGAILLPAKKFPKSQKFCLHLRENGVQ